MRTVSYKLADLGKVVIHLGKMAENDATQVRIDAAEVFSEYPNAVPALDVINPSGEAYTVEVTLDGTVIVWDVKDSSLTAEGNGEIQLTFTQDGTKVKSSICRTKVCRSITGGGIAPDPVQDWLDHANEVLAEVEDAIPPAGTTGQVLAKKSDEDYDLEWVDQGSGGTTDYTDLTNKPQIGGVTLTGNVSLHDIGAAAESDIPDPTSIIDDNSTGASKVWSAQKSNELKSAFDDFNGGSINLLDPSEFEVGKYLVTGGGLSDNSNLTASGYFAVNGSTTYHIYRSDTYTVRVCYYTSESIGGYIYNSLTDISSSQSSFTTPASAKYARISTNKNMITDMGIYATDIKYYIPYQLTLNSKVSIENQTDDTLSDSKKAANAKAVGDIVKYVVTPEKCCKYGDSSMHLNQRLDLDDGSIVTNSTDQCRTDYIQVSVGDKVNTTAIRDICLYDSEFVYIGYINLWSSSGSVVPPSTWSGNYNSNLTTIETIDNKTPAYIRCWGRTDAYLPAVTVLTDADYDIVCLGDSIFGNNEKPFDLGTYIQNITGLKTANCAYGGTTARVIPSGNMSPLGLPSIVDCIVSEDFSALQTPAYWASKEEYRYGVPTLLYSMVDFSKLKIITIAYGTNDYNSDTPIDNENNKLDTSTFCGGLRYAIENLQTKYPGINLILLSPIYRYWSNSSDYSTVDSDSDTKLNLINKKLIDYVDAMEDVAKEYHLPFFNNYTNIGLNKYTAPTWLRDGTHLNRTIGVDKLGHIIANEVAKVY